MLFIYSGSAPVVYYLVGVISKVKTGRMRIKQIVLVILFAALKISAGSC